MNDDKNHEIPGKIGGHIVKEMIETVEERMAEGEKIPAGPTSEGEATNLQNVREENQKSAARAKNSTENSTQT